MDDKIKRLVDYCQGLYRGEDGKTLYLKYLEDIQSITPQELVLVEYEQLKLGLTPKQLLTVVDKLINVFYKSLSQYGWQHPGPNTFINDLMLENTGLRAYLDAFKSKIKAYQLSDLVPDLRQFLSVTKTYNAHLLKIENILFPYMERADERFNGLQIMWSLHDDLRGLWKSLTEILAEHQDASMFHEHHDASMINFDELNIKIGELYFMLYGLAQKQELVLFPSATERLTPEVMLSMRQQSAEYDFSFIEKPEIDVKHASITQINNTPKGLLNFFESETGHMDMEQLQLLLDCLPIDMTLVDEHDKVAFFSRPKDRIFPRSAAIIGRDVRNCHPPESVHVVEDILKAFKRGEQDEASFWIQMRGMFIHIQYFALRNSDGTYRGTLEVSQEISHLRALEGERRLLDW